VKLAEVGLAFSLVGLLIHLGITENVGWWFVVAGFWVGFVPGCHVPDDCIDR
jgi:hypothetical protein